MTLWNKIKLISIMSVCVLLSLLFMFSAIKLLSMQDGSFGLGLAFLGDIIGTILIFDLITSPIYRSALQQFKIPDDGHDWEMISGLFSGLGKENNHGYQCKNCGVKIMFDWADRKYVEAIHTRIGYHPDSTPMLFPITLKDVRSCEEIRMDDALG